MGPFFHVCEKSKVTIIKGQNISRLLLFGTIYIFMMDGKEPRHDRLKSVVSNFLSFHKIFLTFNLMELPYKNIS